MNTGTLASINRAPAGGVPKLPVPEATISALGIEGDRQANTRHHGGPERAVCLYSLERIEALQREGHPIKPGTVGENLTVSGIDWNLMTPGAEVRIGDVRLEITRYTVPCRTIRASFSDEKSDRISQESHPGWSRVYAKVVAGGRVRVGEGVTVNP